MGLPPAVRRGLRLTPQGAPSPRLPRHYQQIQARVLQTDLDWLAAHPDQRARARRYVAGEFFPLYLELQEGSWVSVVFEPFYLGVLGYHRSPIEEVGATPSASKEAN